MLTLNDHSTTVFSYVGRLRDSRKGFELFLDALAILWDADYTRAFKAWVIGGSPQDMAWAVSLAECRPLLKSRLSTGDLIFWGRIEGDALPEFYSRSTALVVPSFREQFCITAVEAMMCGCPVIAARIGGLQDVVVDGRTGSLFDRGNSTSLAGVMATYINNPSLPRWLGANAEVWAREFFNANHIYDALFRLLKDPINSEYRKWCTPSEIAFCNLVIRQEVPKVESLLACDVTSFEDLTSSHSVSFMAQLKKGGKVFVKKYSDRPTYLSCLHKTPYSGDLLQVPQERLGLALLLRDQKFFSPVLAHDLDASLIIQEWSAPRETSDFKETRQVLRVASNLIQMFDPAPQTLPIRNAIQRTLLQQPIPSLQLVEAVDRLVAELHAPLVGGGLRTRRFHPQLELFRISRFLELNAFWLPKEYAIRSQAVISFMLALRPLVPVPPTFAHGSFKTEHLLTPQPRVCDFDHSGYFCGPVDTAHWIWDYFLHAHGSHPGAMLRHLREELVNVEDLYLGACWILAFQLNRDLVYLSRGNGSPARETIYFLYEFTEAFRGIQPIH